ncbi:MAG: M42 family metallopeptidase [bacterium]|jgi:putative aminopeptidase FrvX
MLLKQLSEAFGPPGQEDEVRNILKKEIAPHVDSFWTDTIGNLLAKKEGTSKSGPKIFLAAHMDEVALMVTGIDKNGFLKVKTLGGIDQRILVAKTVYVGRKRIPGVIGSKAIHLLDVADMKKALQLKELFVDIGAKSKEDAEQLVSLGDGVVFQSAFAQIGNNYYKGKALDDRVGCAALVRLLQQEYPGTIYAAFTVQEEVGLRGSRVAAYGIYPDLAIVLEATAAADVPEAKSHQMATRLGQGPAVTIMDSTLVADPKLLRDLQKIAAATQIPYQWREFAQGGTDGGMLHLTGSGIPTLVISVPCRYLHAPVSIIAGKDYENLIQLVHAYLKQLS